MRMNISDMAQISAPHTADKAWIACDCLPSSMVGFYLPLLKSIPYAPRGSAMERSQRTAGHDAAVSRWVPMRPLRISRKAPHAFM